MDLRTLPETPKNLGSGMKIKIDGDQFKIKRGLRKAETLPIDGAYVVIVDNRHFSGAKVLAKGVVGAALTGAQSGHVEVIITGRDGRNVTLSYPAGQRSAIDAVLLWAAKFNAWSEAQASSVAISTSSAVS